MSEAADTAIGVLGSRIGLRPHGPSRGRIERAVAQCASEDGEAAEPWARRLATDAERLQRLVDRVTVQESAFFRHPEHFEVVAEHLAGLDVPAGRRVIWSAGCADGQEAWSLAMVLEERDLPDWTVVATDVSTAALERATAGVYPERQLRGLSPERRDRFMRVDEDGGWSVAAELRRRVRFLAHNLAGDPPPPALAACPVVLLRNVLIYLESEDTARLLAGLHRRMPSDGLLLLGAAESLPPDHPHFSAERRGPVFVYRPRAHQAAPGGRTGAPARGGRRRRRPPAGPSAADHAHEGERCAAAGDHAGAAEAFRRAAYLEPGDPLHHLRLGLALERAGDPAALRAYRAARAALRDGGGQHVQQAIGWSVGEVGRLLDGKLDAE